MTIMAGRRTPKFGSYSNAETRRCRSDANCRFCARPAPYEQMKDGMHVGRTTNFDMKMTQTLKVILHSEFAPQGMRPAVLKPLYYYYRLLHIEYCFLDAQSFWVTCATPTKEQLNLHEAWIVDTIDRQ